MVLDELSALLAEPQPGAPALQANKEPPVDRAPPVELDPKVQAAPAEPPTAAPAPVPAVAVEPAAAEPAPPAAAEPANPSSTPSPTPSLQINPETSSMIPWIATKQFTVDLFPSWTKTEGDKDWSLGAVTVDVPDIAKRLDQLIASLNEDQWEIKMVVPLDKSLTYHEHQKVVRQGTRREPEAVLGAFGLGWAAGTTASLLVVCQRTEWLDASEYKARIKARQDRMDGETRQRERSQIIEQNAAINAKITTAQKQLEELKANGVTVKKSGLLRSEKFLVGGVEYTNRTEAEAAHRARLGELEADLAALPKQLKSLPPEA
ncbi:hypothetical protein [Phreatobacter sp. AB_2022a]|uniref:hypothetical protein n=1 Tax=Phreatobacter sp. AB_2022a TaxID=3003134 RepID=UPI002287400A|nr:hypothetical protein [Phreatobacter sp. AB_2022a]MCZ0732615.1 hypothetical protein [Phreatobacter sp. AB_2022a]